MGDQSVPDVSVGRLRALALSGRAELAQLLLVRVGVEGREVSQVEEDVHHGALAQVFGGEGRDHLDVHGAVHVSLDVGDGDAAQLALREAQQEAADLLRLHEHDLGALLGDESRDVAVLPQPLQVVRREDEHAVEPLPEGERAVGQVLLAEERPREHELVVFVWAPRKVVIPEKDDD